MMSNGTNISLEGNTYFSKSNTYFVYELLCVVYTTYDSLQVASYYEVGRLHTMIPAAFIL